MLTATATSDGKVNLFGKQGTTWDVSFKVYQDAENTIPLDLTGYSARSQYRKDYKATSPVLISFTCAVDLTGDKNTVTLHASAAASTDCLVYSGVYDVEIYTEADADVKRIAEGALTMDQEVTKP